MEKEIYIDTISNEILEKQMLYWDNGNVREEWYGLNGDFHGSDFHRSDGPAYIYYYLNGNIDREYYYLYGKNHREMGPASILYCENGDIRREYYYLNGKKIRDPLQIEEINNKSIQNNSIQKSNINIKQENFIQTKKRRIFIIEE